MSTIPGAPVQAARTPVPHAEPARRIRALHTDETVTVYQAYSPALGVPAARDGRFPAAWKRERMTWRRRQADSQLQSPQRPDTDLACGHPAKQRFSRSSRRLRRSALR